MKINLLLSFLFITIIIIASDNSADETNLIGCTELNGNGCVCHTVERDFSVDVWVEGPDTLYVGEMGLYKMFLAGGPAEGGGYNVAGRFGEMVLVDTFSFQHPLAMNELTQAFSIPFPTPQDTIYWEFGYLASDSSFTDTIYSCGISLVWDTIPDPLDRWNFGPKFPLTILPVTSVDPDDEKLPDNFVLSQNYPNPFNPTTKIKYTISQSIILSEMKNLIPIQLKVYDILGNEIAILVNEEKPAGNYEVVFGGDGLTSGVYFYQLRAGNPLTGSGQGFMETKKMVLLR